MGITLPIPTFKHDDCQTWPSLLPLYFVSQVLHLSPWTLRQWDKKGKLVAIRMGERQDRRYKKEDIVRVLNEGIKKGIEGPVGNG